MKLLNKIIISVLIVFMITGYVYARPVVDITTPDRTLSIGETFDIEIMIGDDETELAAGIFSVSVGITFDPSIIGFVSYSLADIWEDASTPWTTVIGDDNADPLYKANEFMISTQTLYGERYENYTSNVLIATLTFETIGIGSTDLITKDANFIQGGEDFFLWNFDCIDTLIEFKSGTVKVDAVPVPSSLLLLGSGIFAAIGITRRKK